MGPGLTAFNRWLEEEWGYSYQDRLIAAPMLSLADPVAATEEVERLIGGGARIVHVRPAPVPGPNGTSRDVVELARRLGRNHDPAVRQKLARLHSYAETGRWNALRGRADGGRFAEAFVFAPASSIYGGTDELQRNIVAERAIGLPRDPRLG